MITLEIATRIANGVLAEGARRGFAPLCAVVLDAGGHILCLVRDERASIHRPQIAMAKASGCIGLGVGGRTLAGMAKERPTFIGALSDIFPNGCVAAPGGVLIRDAGGKLLGAVGVTGDQSDNDEACAKAAIERAGLIADTGD
ncbi:GlcG/HbpS family heme-binding protein [Sphingopyxis indica]|uniref:Uncharacterized conserved protein GlcG, DUF336 family n=1 Tax=Sphingopyxis indica TaxID=436663 RepID=A0A239HCF3_9SPHN|nr:heme-binding protein [Sphingopyxis indica]SNS78841.1 Uncharacterized conserved protein GlcG, DUF336 family [Sphingopyxis indica]